MKEAYIRVDNSVDEYLSKGDISNENANIPHNPSGLILAIGGKGLKKDYLNRMSEAGFEKLVD